MMNTQEQRAMRLKLMVLLSSVLLGAFVHFSNAAVLADRPSVSNYAYAVDFGTWCGRAIAERSSAIGCSGRILPTSDSQQDFVHNVKYCVSQIAPLYVDQFRADGGGFLSWLADASHPYFPMYTTTGLLEQVSAPTNYFITTPWRPTDGSGSGSTTDYTYPPYDTRSYGWMYLKSIITNLFLLVLDGNRIPYATQYFTNSPWMYNSIGDCSRCSGDCPDYSEGVEGPAAFVWSGGFVSNSSVVYGSIAGDWSYSSWKSENEYRLGCTIVNKHAGGCASKWSTISYKMVGMRTVDRPTTAVFYNHSSFTDMDAGKTNCVVVPDDWDWPDGFHYADPSCEVLMPVTDFTNAWQITAVGKSFFASNEPISVNALYPYNPPEIRYGSYSWTLNENDESGFYFDYWHEEGFQFRNIYSQIDLTKILLTVQFECQ